MTIVNLKNIKEIQNVVFWTIWKQYTITPNLFILNLLVIGRKKFIFRKKNNTLTDKKQEFDDASLKQLDNVVEESIELCMQYFHWFENEGE